jgi:small subunit ribosomal protein S16
MVVRIRLARHGTRNNPFHHIVVINQRVARNAKPIELVGVFDPIPRAPETPFPKYPFQNDGALLKSSILPDVEKVKKVEWSVERIKYWISVGAQPSKAVMRLLDMVCTIL